MRLTACRPDGRAVRLFHGAYDVDADRHPAVAPLRAVWWDRRAQPAFRAGDAAALAALEREARERHPDDSGPAARLALLRRLLVPPSLQALEDLPSTVTTARVAEIGLEAEQVGWGCPLRNRVGADGGGPIVLQVGGQVFETGLYAPMHRRGMGSGPERCGAGWWPALGCRMAVTGRWCSWCGVTERRGRQ